MAATKHAAIDCVAWPTARGKAPRIDCPDQKLFKAIHGALGARIEENLSTSLIATSSLHGPHQWV